MGDYREMMGSPRWRMPTGSGVASRISGIHYIHNVHSHVVTFIVPFVTTRTSNRPAHQLWTRTRTNDSIVGEMMAR